MESSELMDQDGQPDRQQEETDAPANPEAHILRSWKANARAWRAAIDGAEIESRALVTNDAIVNAVTACTPASVMDVGCGEGWLARALARKGIRVQGVDAIPELVAAAQARGGAEFSCCSYTDLAQGRFDGLDADIALCNFSLLGKESVEQLLPALARVTHQRGLLIIQSLHPFEACGDLPYVSGWRPSSWDGFGTEFRDPAPWYFRTLADWLAVLSHGGWRLKQLIEPLHPLTQRPVSVIFVADKDG